MEGLRNPSTALRVKAQQKQTTSSVRKRSVRLNLRALYLSDINQPRSTLAFSTFHALSTPFAVTMDEDRPQSVLGELPLPTLRIQRASGDIDGPVHGLPSPTSDSMWHCCQCRLGTEVFIHPGQHPIGALACECPHKPCGNCSISGEVKPFLPIDDEPEPTVVPASEYGNEIPFGIICPCCGLSWRARETGRYKKSLRKMPSVSLAQHHQNRLAPEKGRLRKSRSSNSITLGSKRIITPPGIGKQAEYATIKFGGFECTCGKALDLSALCFQIVPADQQQVEVAAEATEKWSTTPELQAMGHDQPTIKIRGVSHPNPLRSCPVTSGN